jgi:hypothetical protein
MVGFGDFVGVDIAPVKKMAVKCTYVCEFQPGLVLWVVIEITF